MTECSGNQTVGSTVTVQVVEKTKSTDRSLVVTSESVKETTCIPECASVTELIHTTVEQLCMVDRDDSCGPRDEANMSPEPVKPSCDTFTEGQGWQKRGRFIIWPVSLDKDDHL